MNAISYPGIRSRESAVVIAWTRRRWVGRAPIIDVSHGWTDAQV
jgi:hypothetical protein